MNGMAMRAFGVKGEGAEKVGEWMGKEKGKEKEKGKGKEKGRRRRECRCGGLGK
jgi:hypothetical protein